MKKLLLPLAIVLPAAVLIAIFIAGNKPTPPAPKNAPPTGENHTSQGQQHIQDGEAHAPYNSDLPSSGPHYGKPAAWGLADKQLADETLIHNMEHGGIVITYKPDLPAAQVDKLKQLVVSLPESNQFRVIKVVVVPRAANVKPIMMGAWTYTQNLDNFDLAKITAFYNGHLDKGPELVP